MSPQKQQHFFLGLLISLLICSHFAWSQTFSDPAFSLEKLTTLPPWRAVGLAFAPDGRIFIWQKDGVIKIFKNGALLSTPFLDLRAQVNNNGDRGLIGFAFDPDFANNGFVYLAYVYEDPNTADKDQAVPKTQRVSRFQADPSNPDRGLANSEVVILGKITVDGCSGIGEDCIPNDAHEHTIDSVVFAPDGKLFVSVGEGGSSTGTQAHSFRAQNLDSLNGKLLRINKDSSGPADNPFYDGNPNSNRSKVWAWGLRNPYRFALHPSTAEPYIGDVGWFEWEEIDHGRGKNFGWPCFEGGTDSSGKPFSKPQSRYQSDFPTECSKVPSSAVTAPLYTYSHTEGATVVASTFYTGSIYPSDMKGNLFFGDYANQWIRRLILDANGDFAGVKTFATGVDGIVNIVQGPDDLLYIVSFTTGNIWRVKYSGALNRAPVAKASAAPTNGYAPLDVTFSSTGSSDPDGGTLSYLWDFNDGTTSTAANPVHRYTPTGVQSFTATLSAKDTGGLTANDAVKITVGSKPPTATILAPADGTKAKVGDLVTYSGTGTDPDDGNLPGSALKWTVLLHHNTHIHTVSESVGAGGSFTVEDHDPVGVFSYEIILTVTDSSGLSDTRHAQVFISHPSFSLSPPSIDFGNVNVGGKSQSQNVLVTNTGDTALAVGNAQASVPFASTTDCPAQLQSGAKCNYQISFAPTQNGTANGSLQVVDASGGAATQTVSLTGTGVIVQGATDFSITSVPSEQTVASGAQAKFSVEVTAINGFNGAVTFACSNLPAGATCAFSPSTLNVVSAKSTVALTVSTAPTVAAARLSWGTILFAAFLYPCLGFALAGSRSKRTLVFASALAITLCLSACRSALSNAAADRPPQTQTQSYSITVTGTSSDKQRTSTVQLHVQ